MEDEDEDEDGGRKGNRKKKEWKAVSNWPSCLFNPWRGNITSIHVDIRRYTSIHVDTRRYTSIHIDTRRYMELKHLD